MSIGILRLYYLSTPVFFILYHYFNLNLRLSIPGAPDWLLYGYYLCCFLASFIVFKNAVSGAFFSLVESALNLLLLLLSVMLPVYSIASLDEGNVGFHFGVSELLHFLIAGFVVLYSFYANPLLRK